MKKKTLSPGNTKEAVAEFCDGLFGITGGKSFFFHKLYFFLFLNFIFLTLFPKNTNNH